MKVYNTTSPVHRTRRRLRGYLVVFGGFLVQFTLGAAYTFGNMAPYLASCLRHHGDTSVTNDKMVWIGGLNMVGLGALMMVGGYLEKILGGRITCILGSALLSGGVALAYFTVTTSLVWTVILLGLISGVGSAFAYVPAMACSMRWFPEARGLVSGCTLAGMGLGALVFNQILTIYINPDNYPANDEGYFTDEGVLDRTPKSMLLLAGTFAGIQIIGCGLMANPKTKDNSLIDSVSSSPNENSSTTTEPTTTSLSLREALRTREFYILWIIYCINNQVVQYLNILYKTYGQTFIKDDKFLALVGSLSSIFNSGGRIVWGFIIDRINVKICMTILCTASAVLYLTLTQTEHLGKGGFAVWIWISFFFFSGNYAIFPATCAKTFGPEYAGPIYGLVGTAMLAAGVIFSFATEDMSSGIGWFYSFLIQAVMSFVSVVCILFYRDTYHINNKVSGKVVGSRNDIQYTSVVTKL